MEIPAEGALATWSAPQCPFTIEYVPRVLDDIRLAVVDAFLSLPRGGAEIGGLLLGRFEKGRVTIVDYEALDCEHASGPSFALSSKDHATLAEMLAKARGNREARPVGWYHSHTLSAISLSEADLEIHQRYFPEAWQVALVLKPHAFQPTRAGFFFRAPDGAIHETASYRVFEMEPLVVRPLPGVAASVRPIYQPEPEPPKPLCLVEPVRPKAPSPPTAPSPDPAIARLVVPRRSLRLWIGLLAATLALAIGAWVWHVREMWMPASPAPPAYLGLNTIDSGGQLQIRWDRNSAAVRNARGALLTIGDGGLPQSVDLDAAHLQAGVFTYGRKGDRIDVAMTLRQPDGLELREATTYLGKLPDPDPALRQERDDLARQLQAEHERSKKLEKLLQEQKRRRMGNQSR